MMNNNKRRFLYKTIENITPSFVKGNIKKIYWRIVRIYNKYRYIEKGRFVEFGYRFRFSRKKPYRAYIGERSITEDFNVWNARGGDIIVGKRCWFGLFNIVMGPVEIGNDVSTGPYVSILGPRHPTLDLETRKRKKTVIEDKVMIHTGSIILFGVKIGEGAIIGAGSVVTKDVQAGAFVSGNPARDLTKIAGKLWEMDVLVQERFRKK
jgi:acetyltransferase-like isoleucine patch superfamily enzyme